VEISDLLKTSTRNKQILSAPATLGGGGFPPNFKSKKTGGGKIATIMVMGSRFVVKLFRRTGL